jgi:hypothetical protein
MHEALSSNPSTTHIRKANIDHNYILISYNVFFMIQNKLKILILVLVLNANIELNFFCYSTCISESVAQRF